MTEFEKHEQDDSAAQFQGQHDDPTPPPIPSPAPAAVQPEDRSPNVILSKEREDEALNEGLTNIGSTGIILPDAEGQIKGFYLPQEEAAVLVGQFRQYKFLVSKGQETPPVSI